MNAFVVFTRLVSKGRRWRSRPPRLGVGGARPARDAADVKSGSEPTLGGKSEVFATLGGAISRTRQNYGGRGSFLYLW